MSKSRGSNHVANWRNRTKEKLVLYKGAKCEKCGYSNLNYLRVFEFHHTDKTEKDFTISGKSWSYERLKQEVDKCIMVCSNCHKEIHEDLDREVRESRQKTERPKGWRKRDLTIKKCLFCKKETKNTKFCSLKCSSSNQATSIIRPKKDELLKLKETMSNIEVGRIYNVSEMTIRKWLKL